MKCKINSELDLLLPVTVWLRFRLLTAVSRCLDWLGIWYTANNIRAYAWRIVGLEVVGDDTEAS